MITGIILSIEELSHYPKEAEKGIRVKTGTHSFVSRVRDDFELEIGQKIEASNVVCVENTGDYTAHIRLV